MQPRNIILLLLLLAATNGYAQPRARLNESVQNKKAPTPTNISTIFSPTILSAPLPHIGIQGGVQYQNRQWGYLGEVSIPLYKRSDFTQIEYFRIGAEVKKYLHSKPHVDDYISLHTSFAHRSFINPYGGSYYMRNRDSSYNFSSAKISSPALSATLRIGQQFRMGRTAWFDMFAGAGVRTLFTQYRNVQGLNVSEAPRDMFPTQYMYNFNSVYLNLEIGFRIGFKLTQEIED
jgi:hypothetical protein